MIILVAGASHTGKTAFAQRLLEKYKMPYLSIDHLKMGLIRSGNTDLTPADDEKLTEYLWPIVREIIKTAAENRQNLIVEGCYIPFDWQKDFGEDYLKNIRCVCLVMTEKYIENHFSDILDFGDVIEKRQERSPDLAELINENRKNLAMCKKYGLEYILIDEKYEADIEF